MKVKDLIEKLETFSQDVDVKIEYYYEWDGFYCEDVTSDKIKMHKDGFVCFAEAMGDVINAD